MRYDEYDSELDSDPDEEAKRKAKQNQVAALMQDTNDLDDEVEKVLGHRWAANFFCGVESQSKAQGHVCQGHVLHKAFATLLQDVSEGDAGKLPEEVSGAFLAPSISALSLSQLLQAYA